MNSQTEKYLRYILNPLELFGTERTREILVVNPTIIPIREEATRVNISAFIYDKSAIEEKNNLSVDEVLDLRNSDKIIWINVDGLRKVDVEKIGEGFGIHPLLVEDVLSINQRPKMDEIDDILFSLMNMMYFNKESKSIEQEQISLVLGNNFVITFQEDADKDVFKALRGRLKLPTSKTRTKKADYLYYTLIDAIVDHYFLVMEQLGDAIEDMEETIVRSTTNKRALATINLLRKELIVLKRNIFPVRDLIANIIKSENDLLTVEYTRYYKDVHDHSLQAIDLVDNYRDMIMGMQDLYINNVNLKLNEVMKVMAIVTCLLAPATVIGGIFGMNFNVIPLSSHKWGFWIAVGVMLIIPLWMLSVFKRKKWF